MTHDNRVELAKTALKGSEIFHDLPRGAIERLARTVRFEEYKTSTLLLEKGETSKYLIYVVTGQLVTRTFTRAGESVDSNNSGPGQWTHWGPPFIEGYKASRDLWSSAGATLLAFPAETVREIARENPDIYARVIGELLKRQGAILNFFHQSALGDNERTLAQLLLSNCVISHSQRHIELSMTQQEIGKLTGFSRKKVSGLLKSLETEGLIKPGYGTVTVLDRNKLQAFIQHSEPPTL